MVALLIILWVFGVASFLYGTTLLYWAWHSPDDASAAKWHIVAGVVCVGVAVWIMNKI